MTDSSTNAARTFVTDAAVMLGDKVLVDAGTTVTVRKPDSGALRGLKLLDLSQMDVVALETLAPRITQPMLVKGCTIDPADLMQFGSEVLDFLLPKAAREAVSPTA